MKILHVINSFAAGGAEKLVMELANQQSLKNNVSIYTFKSDCDIFSDSLDKRINFKTNKFNRFYSLKGFIALFKLVRQHDVIHVHLFPSFYIVALVSFFLREQKYFYTEHNTTNKRRKRIFRLIESIVYSRYRKIICVSKGAENELRKWMGNRVTTKIINNFIDSNKISKIKSYNRIDFGFNLEDKILIMVGSFENQKDQITIIKCLSLLPAYFHLILIGDGSKREECIAFCQSKKVNNRVHFLGVRKDVIEIVKFCDYGILSSNWEGFGLVAAEYIASNLISIGTNVEGLNNVISNKKCLFQVGNYTELKEIILNFENNKLIKDRVKLEQSISLEKYDISQAVQQHLTVYTN